MSRKHDAIGKTQLDLTRTAGRAQEVWTLQDAAELRPLTVVGSRERDLPVGRVENIGWRDNRVGMLPLRLGTFAVIRKAEVARFAVKATDVSSMAESMNCPWPARAAMHQCGEHGNRGIEAQSPCP